MPKLHPFTEEQLDVLHAVVERAARDKKRFRRQEDLAHALDMTQPSLSSLLKRKWKPGITTARYIAQLEKSTLEDMIGSFSVPEAPPSEVSKKTRGKGEQGGFTNLTTCVEFYAGTKAWSPWTIAAAAAGYFGTSDFTPPAWVEKLDKLEKVLEGARIK